MHYSPSFWVAISFFIFIILAWSFIRKSLLNVINNYRNSISSSYGEMIAQREESKKLLEISIAKLEESNSNQSILSAHKTASQILHSSEAKIALLKNHINTDSTLAVKAFQEFVYKKMKQNILENSSYIVECYIVKHESEFNKIAIQNTLKSFSN